MKKMVLLALAVGMLIFTSCGSDDPPPRTPTSVCETCTVPGEPNFTVCKGGNGNAFVSNQDTGVVYEEYVSGVELAGAACD